MWEEEPQVVAQERHRDRTNRTNRTRDPGDTRRHQETSGDPGPFFGVDGLWRPLQDGGEFQAAWEHCGRARRPHWILVHRSIGPFLLRVFLRSSGMMWKWCRWCRCAHDVMSMSKGTAFFSQVLRSWAQRRCSVFQPSASGFPWLESSAVQGVNVITFRYLKETNPRASVRSQVWNLLCTMHHHLHHLFSHVFMFWWEKLCIFTPFAHVNTPCAVLPRAAALQESPFQLAPRQISDDFEDSFCMFLHVSVCFCHVNFLKLLKLWQLKLVPTIEFDRPEVGQAWQGFLGNNPPDSVGVYPAMIRSYCGKTSPHAAHSTLHSRGSVGKSKAESNLNCFVNTDMYTTYAIAFWACWCALDCIRYIRCATTLRRLQLSWEVFFSLHSGSAARPRDPDAVFSITPDLPAQLARFLPFLPFINYSSTPSTGLDMTRLFVSCIVLPGRPCNEPSDRNHRGSGQRGTEIAHEKKAHGDCALW